MPQAADYPDVIPPPLRREDVEASAIENEIELPVEPSVEYVILTPGDFEPLFLRLFTRQADGRLGNIGRRHSESLAGESHRFLFTPQCDHRVYARGPARRQIAGHQRHREHQQRRQEQ